MTHKNGYKTGFIPPSVRSEVHILVCIESGHVHSCAWPGFLVVVAGTKLVGFEEKKASSKM